MTYIKTNSTLFKKFLKIIKKQKPLEDVESKVKSIIASTDEGVTPLYAHKEEEHRKRLEQIIKYLAPVLYYSFDIITLIFIIWIFLYMIYIFYYYGLKDSFFILNVSSVFSEDFFVKFFIKFLEYMILLSAMIIIRDRIIKEILKPIKPIKSESGGIDHKKLNETAEELLFRIFVSIASIIALSFFLHRGGLDKLPIYISIFIISIGIFLYLTKER